MSYRTEIILVEWLACKLRMRIARLIGCATQANGPGVCLKLGTGAVPISAHYRGRRKDRG